MLHFMVWTSVVWLQLVSRVIAQTLATPTTQVHCFTSEFLPAVSPPPLVDPYPWIDPISGSYRPGDTHTIHDEYFLHDLCLLSNGLDRNLHRLAIAIL